MVSVLLALFLVVDLGDNMGLQDPEIPPVDDRLQPPTHTATSGALGQTVDNTGNSTDRISVSGGGGAYTEDKLPALLNLGGAIYPTSRLINVS